ncbi:MAG: phospholipase D-like domain-containing protein [Cyclobacteriaceae bacterium]
MSDEFKLVHSGKEYFDLLESLISNAEDSIHLLVYTFIEDETGRKIAQELIAAAERKVEVNLLVDAFGSKELSDELIEAFYESGIRFRKFSPYLTGHIYSAGRRMHMKAVVVDYSKILIGGINISNNYNGYKSTAWLDYAVLMKDEVIANNLTDYYWHLYNRKLSKRVYSGYSFENQACKILINDWLYQTPAISRELNSLVESSRKEITIMISYFLPGRRFIRLLSEASKRGVKIKLINSANWDIPFMRRAIHYLYPRLQRSHITIYEWKPSVLHSKVMVFDHQICSIGSYNINGLSRYNSLEMNAFVKNKTFVDQIKVELNQLINDEKKVVRINQYEPGWFSNMLNWMNYKLVRASLSIMFLLINAERKDIDRGIHDSD